MGVFCSECKKEFSSQSTFNRHMRNVHKKLRRNYIEYAVPKKYLCFECKLYFNFNNDLRLHLKEKHDHITESVNLEFRNFSDFSAWLSQEESQNNVQYCKVRGISHIKETERLYFECARSSQKYSQKKNRIRALKSQGSCKMVYSCTSQIIVKKNKNGKCEVTYFKTHYGHSQEIQHLHLLQEDKEFIASKLILGVPPKRILENIRDNTSEKLTRFNLTTREDIKNIKKCYGIDLKGVERVIKPKKGKFESHITSNHRSALVSTFTVSQNNNVYILKNQKNHEYIVERKNNVKCCFIKCTPCNICIHSYTCSCIDFLIRSTICKHIHFVALHQKQPEYSSQSVEMSGEVQKLVSHTSHQPDINNLKEQIRTKVHCILQTINSEELSKEQLTSILHHVTTAAAAVSNIPLNKFNAVNSEVKTEPGNKNIVKQKSFFSTRKNPKSNNDIIVSSDPINDHQYTATSLS